MLFQATHKTPVGELFLVSDEHILLASGFRSFKDLLARMDQADAKREVKSVKNIPVISDLISDYFAGDLTALGGIKVRQSGAEFSQEV
jgi:methylated-DNA-[protein]-cysteine S-methyltransferase